jgi:hypothetical protein
MRELPDEAHELLDAARGAHDPAPAERARGDAAVRTALAAHGLLLPPLASGSGAPMADVPASSAPAPSAASGSAWSGAKLALGALALCVAGAAGWHAARTARAPRPAPSAVAAAPASPAAAAAPSAGSSLAPDRSLAAAAAARVTAPAAAPREARVRRRRAPAQPNLNAEVQLIAAADALVRSERYGAAMRTLALHERRFPRGELRQERSALRVLSMCGRGSSAPALRARDHFLTTAPDSVLTARVRSACSADGAPDP